MLYGHVLPLTSRVQLHRLPLALRMRGGSESVLLAASPGESGYADNEAHFKGAVPGEVRDDAFAFGDGIFEGDEEEDVAQV